MQAVQNPENKSEYDKFSKLEDLEFPFCDEVGKYEKLTKIGQGTFGYVLYTYVKCVLIRIVL